MEQDILDRLYYGKIVPWEKRRGNTPEMERDCVPHRTSAPKRASMRFVLTIMPERFIASSGMRRPKT